MPVPLPDFLNSSAEKPSYFFHAHSLSERIAEEEQIGVGPRFGWGN